MAESAEAQKGDKRKPWLRQKRGETSQAYQRRTNHTCYACGVYIEDLTALDAHEAGHR